MKRVCLAATMTATLLLATSANAGQMPVSNGLSIDINGGYAKIQTPNDNMPNVSGSSNKTVSPVYGGEIGWQWSVLPHVWLGIEAGYNNDGQSSYEGTAGSTSSTAKVKQKDIDGMFSAGFVVDGGFNIFGKAGLAYVTQKTSGVNATSSSNFDKGNNSRSQGRTKFEMGLGYMFIQNLNITLTYGHIFGKDNTNFPIHNGQIISNNTGRLGVSYTFPIG